MNCNTYQGWMSKRDIVKDLAKASGKYYVRDLDGHVLVGEQPPPLRHIPDGETDLQLLRLYGGCKPRGNDASNNIKPDLAGITQMLRMVDGFTKEPAEAKLTTNHKTTDIVRISKLNPNVEEFIPKNNNDSSDKETKPQKTDVKNCDNVSNVSVTVDKNQLTTDEVKDMREKLKAKINDTSKTACLKVKRERNLAIATLMKLYSQNTKPEPEPTLLSPDYFEKIPPSSVKITDKTEDENIAASVDKVNKWLRTTEKEDNVSTKPVEVNESKRTVTPSKKNPKKSPTDLRKSSPLYLGTVTFKRKASSKPMSPTSNDSVERIKAQKSNFVPSSYASELSKIYLERSLIKDALEQDLWTRLENELKAKDEEIKNRQLNEVVNLDQD